MAMSRIRTVDFLPEIFRTETNKQFLNATLDQLTQNPKLKPTQGYIGRQVGPGVNPNDSYVLEPTKTRADYQLEPGVVFLKENTNTAVDAITYPGLVDAVGVQGGITNRQDRLWSSEYYAFDPFIDYDKFVNFSQYFWIPGGPDSVTVSPTAVPSTNDFNITRTDRGYTIEGYAGFNPTISIVRGGSYTFNVNQTGYKLYIQSVPGVKGVLPATPNQTSRDVLGVTNNGEDLGTIDFSVPAIDAQNFYFNYTNIGGTDFATTLTFDEINGQDYATFMATHGGIDGFADIINRTVIFITPGLDLGVYNVWRITLVGDTIQLVLDQNLAAETRTTILYGNTYANISFFKNESLEFEQIPLITADLDLLYYQDNTDPTFFGAIKVIDDTNSQTINVDTEILGRKNYISPNGVTFTNGMKVQFQGAVVPSSYVGLEYYVEGVGQSIKLLPVSEFITPETYTESASTPYDSTPYDVGGYDATENAPLYPDYMTINRASIDQNAWSRSNRWFHIDVIYESAQYNKVAPVVDNAFRAKRPIIEFRPDIRLFNFGTESITPVNIIDFKATDAMSTIDGSIGYSVDGYAFINGSRVIFANDTDPEVRNKVYEVSFITPSGSGTPVINLQPSDLRSPDVLIDQTVVCLSGVSQQGKSYWFNGATWVLAQQKTSINQPPLFDVFDQNGYSFADIAVYPSSTFNGTKLFSYAVGNGVEDQVLGQPLKYLTINNVGDIVFENNLYTDSFIYVENTIGITEPIQAGVVRQYSNRTTYRQLLGWQPGFTETVSRQSFKFTYANQPLIVDVPVTTDLDAIPVKVFVESNFLQPSGYTYAINSNGSTTITFNQWVFDQDIVTTGTIIEVSVVSDVASNVGFYSVPLNLENNPLNDNVTELTLGTIRTHYGTICQNLKDFSGEINGQNNTRDLGNIVPYGQIVLQQSSPLGFAGVFLRTGSFEFARAVDFNAGSYQQYKNLILDTVAKLNVENKTAAQVLDEALAYINVGKTQMSPFYWSDMIPSGDAYEQTVYNITPVSTNTFDLLYSYDLDSANYTGFLVYLNDGVEERLLVGDNREYSYVNGTRKVTVLVDLQVGDVVTIREYQNTSGSFVPNTPTKLRLYPAYEPMLFLDDTYINPTWVIQGHDGSITVAFEDFRDNVLLEFERRVYDNLKGEHQRSTLSYEDVAPGQFRKTEYAQSEITQILNLSFLTWVGANKLDYREQDYVADNAFTWNYSSSADKINQEPLLGNWRGIYNYFYDTNYPHTRPWEMLGFSEEPSWWQLEYGAAPYTSGNMVLWEDLEAGLVKDPAGPFIDPIYARPGLTKVIPVDSQGNLLPPINTTVGSYDTNGFRKSWVAGDEGPVEAAWRRSSFWPFAVMKLLSVTKPAKFFALNVDRDLYQFNDEYAQYLYEGRFRVNPTNIEIYGNGTSKASYIDWIVDYNRVSGLDSTTDLQTTLANIDVRLCYRMASFSDKQYLKIYTEKSSPDSTNTSLLLPDESFQVLLYKNPTFDTITWSSVIIQRTENGYTVYGYSTNRPYFEILTSVPNGTYRVIRSGEQVVRVNTAYSDTVVQVPYGYEFVSEAAVVDFLMSYGQLLERQGMSFTNVENTKILNWDQMGVEFLYWSQQGWGPGSLINLNPAADLLEITRVDAIVEPLNSINVDDIILDQNKRPLANQDYVVDRVDNTLRLIGINNQTFNYLYAKFTAYENIIVFDNTSVFNDLIYKPITGARQNRLLFTGYTTYDWNGQLDAQGFILNQDNIIEWQPNTTYSKGQIVLYKGSYWSAAKVIPPAEKFDFSVWIKSDYNQIQKGLLPNLATKDELIRNYYNISSANLERDADLLSFGLIGFRPREYMQALNLDDISQVNLYQQFLGTKGTRRATDIFTRANLNKEVAEYEIFENWAIQRARYGATASRAYFEIQLNQALLQSNPSTVQVISPGQSSTADQTVVYNNLWKESYKITGPDILPTTTLVTTDISLPSAGYVNYDDVGVKAFDWLGLSQAISDYTSQVGESNLIVGTPIWVAKINDYNWGVYRTNLANGSVIKVSDNLNGTCTLTFNMQHGLNPNQKIIVKQFGDDVDGVYDVLTVPSLYTITITLSLAGTATEITGNGRCFYLGTMRVSTPSQVESLPYVNSLLPGAQVWVDNIGDNTWAVYQKTTPFSVVQDVNGNSTQPGEKFGWAVAQGFVIPGALVGAPGYNNDKGAVYGFALDVNNNYVETAVLTADTTTDMENFGWSIDVGSNEWAIIGAPSTTVGRGHAAIVYRNPNTGDYILSQLLVPSTEIGTDEFGYSVAISPDERWAYVGIPSTNLVAAYSRVDVQFQVKEFTGDGSTTSFDTSDTIIVNNVNTSVAALQIGVTVNNLPKYPNVSGNDRDYSYNGSEVVFNVAPNLGDKIRVIRNQSKSFPIDAWVDTQTWTEGQYVVDIAHDIYIAIDDVPVGVSLSNPAYWLQTNDFDLTSLYTATSNESITVYNNETVLRPGIDYSFDPIDDGSTISVLTLLNPIDNGNLLIISGTYFKHVDNFTVSGLTGLARFGHAITVGNDGSDITVGAPNDTINSDIGAGSVHYLHRTVQKFAISDANVTEFIFNFEIPSPVWITVQGEFLVENNGYNNNGQYTVTYDSGTTTITLDTGILSIGDAVEISTNKFFDVQSISSNNAHKKQSFGAAVDVCPTNCTIYIGAPNDSTILAEAGSADRWINQIRQFGIATTTNQNLSSKNDLATYVPSWQGPGFYKQTGTNGIGYPEYTFVANSLTPGDVLYINNYSVAVETPGAWNNLVSWAAGTFVTNGLNIYRASQNVPVGIAITDTNYWSESSWVESYAQDIVAANVPNITASSSNGFLTIHIVNDDAAIAFNKLEVLPGPNTGTLFDNLGFTTFIWSQTVRSPKEMGYAHFGTSVNAAKNNVTLTVGAPDGMAQSPTTFDAYSESYGTYTYIDTDGEIKTSTYVNDPKSAPNKRATTFDYNTTNFYGTVAQSGVAYTFDYIGNNPVGSINNVAKFVFGQQLYDPSSLAVENFGQSVSYVGSNLLVGAPKVRFEDDSTAIGGVIQFENTSRSPAWKTLYAQQPVVDVYLLDSIYTYDRLTSGVTQYFDFVDPLQGKILGAARQNIDFLGARDPAMYNTGDVNNVGITWGEEHLGKIWWDLSTVRFVDYHQSTLQYSSRRWGQLFPGSSVDVYQWIGSTVPPSEYVDTVGVGTPYSTTSYTINTKLNTNTGVFETRYFFWVKDIPEVATFAKKTLSTTAIKQYIENPRSAGIPYAAALAPSAIALYNGAPYISAQDTILTVNFDRIKNDDNIHTEYDLVADGNPDSFIGAGLYRKLLDSFCGEDTLGGLVPDPTLSPANRYGVQFRPRQSMFVDRFVALQNYLTRANKILALYPIVDMRSFALLNSADPEPSVSSGMWNKRVATYEILTYQDLWAVPLGYKYLVASDETVDGLWTIYTVEMDELGVERILHLSLVQTYDTRQYWTYVNWVKVGYNNNVKPLLEVETYADLLRITPDVGLTVKVLKNSSGKYEVYEYQNTGTTESPVYEWVRVVLEDGTIAIKSVLWDYNEGAFGFDVEVFDAQRFDEAPIAETRQVLKALNEEIFIDDIAIYRNQLLMLAFEYIMTEQASPDWLFKTSLIDVNHKIRDLLPYQIYRRDNQDFVLDYIKEVKPYHVQVREFNLRYEGFDTYKGTLTDFDVPAYFDNGAVNQFVSPILDNAEYPYDPVSARPSTWTGWQQLPYNQWFQNYTLYVDSVTIIDAGGTYAIPPVATVVANPLDPNINNIIPATLSVQLYTNGTIRYIEVLTPGAGYTLTPTVYIEGEDSTGAWAIPVMDNQLVRSFLTTIKFDRYEYTSSVVDWAENTYYTTGELVRFNDTVYEVTEDINSSTQFDPAYYSKVNSALLSAANRVMGYYNPDVNEPGIELALVINGIDYPGVQVYGVNFDQNTGYDVGNFDVNPFDNISYLPDGQPTYDPAILDAIYTSEFTDPYLGTLPAPAYDGSPPDNLGPNPIVIDGGAFVDTYSSHAPEELVPGATFDTLDFRVYTRPGSDWTGDGHGFAMVSRSFTYNSVTDTSLNFGNMLDEITAVRVVNLSTGASLIPRVDYFLNWPDRTVEILKTSSNVFNGNNVEVNVYGLGGGNQIYKQTYAGSDVGNNIVISVNYNEIYDMLVLVNGSRITNYTYSSYATFYTEIEFAETYTDDDVVFIAAMGFESPIQYNYSYPVTQTIPYDGSTTYTLTNSLIGTNMVDAVVERSGQRLRPAEGIDYFGNGTTTQFALPTRGNTNQQYIVDNEVIVFVDNIRKYPALDFVVSPWTGANDRYIEFYDAPAVGARIYISVTTDAEYTINPSNNLLTLYVTAIPGAPIAVTTWNDTRQQGILTQVFVGPTTSGALVSESYDETDYDVGEVTEEPGSFDYSAGIVVYSNTFDTGRVILNPERLWVTKNGLRLSVGEGYTVSGRLVTLTGPIIGLGDVVVITSFTQTVIPAAMEFRIFQDMLGNQVLYRMTENTSTELVADLSADADIIYVKDASNLSEPNLPIGIFGVITINGERITYLNRDTVTNTVSGLRRGVAGTAADVHYVGAVVYDIGRGEALPAPYQQHVYNNTFYGDGFITTFVTDLPFYADMTDAMKGAVRVRVGGTELVPGTGAYTVDSISPTVTVTITDAPAAGVEVNVYIVEAHVMYAQGVGTASDGIALQDQTTLAARFIRGQV
jgi:hypothetical protein